MKRIVILGCTGSIGQQTLDVVRRNPDKLQIMGLACGKRVDEMLAAAQEFGVSVCATNAAEAAALAQSEGSVPAGVELAVGDDAVLELARMGEVDLVVNALVGAAGLRASYETLRAGKILALANKESLVVGGDLLCSAEFAAGVDGGADVPSATRRSAAQATPSCAPLLRSEAAATQPDRNGSKTVATGTSDPSTTCGTAAQATPSCAPLLRSESAATQPDRNGSKTVAAGTSDPSTTRSVSCLEASSLIRPIDSEHGAIFQCLLGEQLEEVTALWVTASGGPFRGRTRAELEHVTPEEALAHPTWNMGPKITIDSSTLMNKGLEVIEAHHLFAMPYDKIRVVVQPQSAIHSMVEFADGSVKAHLGTTDMRIPIQFALSYPDRWAAPVEPLDFTQLGSLEFASADTDTFRCLALARAAGEAGGTLPCAMNAANEIAVAAFLDKRLSYLGIADCVEAVMDAHRGEQVTSIEQLLDVDSWAREAAAGYIIEHS